METKIQNTYRGVDITKFIFSIAIFGMHSTFFDVTGLGLVKQLFVHLGVPYFFVASGFFLGKKIKHIDDDKSIWPVFAKQIRRLSKKLIYLEPISIIINAIELYVILKVSIGRIILETIRDILFTLEVACGSYKL